MASLDGWAGAGKIGPQRWAYAFVFVSTLVSLAVLGTALLGRPGFPLDDSWIHQTVARNLAVYGSLGYLPHERSSGSTSVLWTLVLALKYLVAKRLGPVPYALAVNAACLAGITGVSLRLALRDRMPVALALLWAVSPVVDGNFVWLAFTGMEHLLFVFLSLLSIVLWASAEVSPGLAGVAMGLLAMTRPEGIVLPVLLLLSPTLFPRTPKERLAAVIAAAPLAIIPFAVNLFTSHTLLPLTLKGRQWLYFAGDAHPLRSHLSLFLGWFHRLLLAFEAPPSGSLGVTGRVLTFGGSLLLLALCTAGVLSLWRDRCRLTLIVCGWGLLHSFLYVAILPSTGQGGRTSHFR